MPTNSSMPVPVPMPLPASMGGRQQETGFQKLVRKFKAEPLVPIGLLATTASLGGGLYLFARRADALAQQHMMRARVAAQGATVLAMAVGYLIMLEKSNRDLREQSKHQVEPKSALEDSARRAKQ